MDGAWHKLLFLKYESSGPESLAECGGNSGAVCDCVGCCGVLCSPPLYIIGGKRWVSFFNSYLQ